MITCALLPLSIRTLLAILYFCIMTCGLFACIYVDRRINAVKHALALLCTAAIMTILILHTTIARTERFDSSLPPASMWFASLPFLLPLLVSLLFAAFFIAVITEERYRHKNAITASSIKEAIDHLETGLCFSYPHGLLILTNHRINELSVSIFGTVFSNANQFWNLLVSGTPLDGVERITGNTDPEFRLRDESFWHFQRREFSGFVQITATSTTAQRRLVAELQQKHLALKAMNERIRDYGNEVNAYVVTRERLETRMSLHGFLGQALLMTRHYLQYASPNQEKILETWRRNIDILRMEAKPQQAEDSMASLKNAASAIGIQVYTNGPLPENTQIRSLAAVIGAEALTNAVRHANARHMWIDFHKSESQYTIRYTNDGAVPTGPVTPGGGLSASISKVLSAGGQVRIDSSPRFILTIIFERRAVENV